jgi:transcriptional regulator with PAS, ATPase and Fis domain
VIPRGDATVLITGETGTGKELLAQAIHYNGPRAPHPFMEVNCTALPETLLEAELFGYEKGAFTDARTSKPGLFEAADRGSLFLDEIGDLTLNVQAKLLKVLEEKQVRRLGSIKSLGVDVRVIAATHVDLTAAVAEGRFRADLFYRLNVLPVHLAPLRERQGDLLLLAEHFLDRISEEYDLPRPPLDAATKQAMLAHGWPGNVRELKNAIERAVLLGDGELHVDELLPMASPAPAGGALPFPASLRKIEAAAARLAVERLEGNKSAAADLLGISRTRLYRLLSGEDDV